MQLQNINISSGKVYYYLLSRGPRSTHSHRLAYALETLLNELPTYSVRHRLLQFMAAAAAAAQNWPAAVQYPAAPG
jgi:hypothetical protein